MYTVIDIESTGGKYNEEGIMEIAIFKFDGYDIVDKFVSLINPERKIQAFVRRLTGIDQEMLKMAPKFYEVAKRIVEITENTTIVAHNAQFDYRLLKTEFSRLGFEYKRNTLCTVEMSKKLIPDVPSYSLGKLTKSLGIPMSKRHRAEGDAYATVQLLKILLNKDTFNSVNDYLTENPKKQVDTKLLNFLNQMPKDTGVYFFYDQNNTPLYVGKSKNIYNRVSQHFANVNPKAKSLQQKIEHIKYELTGSELIALLKENEYIKKLQPKYNTSLIKIKFSHGIFITQDDNGYKTLKIKPVSSRDKPITTFSSLKSAKSFLEQMVNKYQLCLNKTSLENTSGSCFNYGLKECLGACIQKEDHDQYNKRIEELEERYSFKNENFLIILKGRNPNEKSFVYVKNGEIEGVGFFDLNLQISNEKILNKILFPIDHKRDAKHIVQSFIRLKPNAYKIVKI